MLVRSSAKIILLLYLGANLSLRSHKKHLSFLLCAEPEQLQHRGKVFFV